MHGQLFDGTTITWDRLSVRRAGALIRPHIHKFTYDDVNNMFYVVRSMPGSLRHVSRLFVSAKTNIFKTDE